MDHRAHLADLLGRLDLRVESPALPRLLDFVDQLLLWNRSINLTAITDFEEAVEKHLVDSLTVLPLLGGRERLLDLGSGAGLPGIPLKLARPELGLTSVDSVGKKIAFQRHIARRLGLEATLVQERGENLPRRQGMAAGFDLVVARAFASLEDFVRLGAPCLAPGGRLLAMKGPEGEREHREARSALEAAGFSLRQLIRLRLPRSGAERTLLVLTRVSG